MPTLAMRTLIHRHEPATIMVDPRQSLNVPLGSNLGIVDQLAGTCAGGRQDPRRGDHGFDSVFLLRRGLTGFKGVLKATS